MSVKPKLNQKVTVLDPLFMARFDPADPLSRTSPYAYNGYQKLSNFGIERDTIQPVGVINPQPGQTARFTITKRQTKLGSIWARITVSPLTPVGGGTCAFVDYAGFRFLENIECRYMSNVLQTLDWRRLHVRHMTKHGPNEFDAECERVGGNLPYNERSMRASEQQIFEVKLPFWWTYNPGLYLITDGLSHQVEINIKLANSGDVTQSTSGQAPTYNIVALELVMEMHHTENAERNYWIDRTMTDSGMIYSMRDWQTQYQNVLVAGQTEYTIDLSQITGAVTNLWFCVRPYSAVTSPGTMANDPFSFIPIKRYQIRSGSTVIQPYTTESQNRTVDNVRNYVGYCGLYYGYSPSMDPMDEINATGHDSFAGFSNPTLYIEFDHDPGQCVVDIITNQHNLFQQKSADAQAVFHP